MSRACQATASSDRQYLKSIASAQRAMKVVAAEGGRGVSGTTKFLSMHAKLPVALSASDSYSEIQTQHARHGVAQLFIMPED